MQTGLVVEAAGAGVLSPRGPVFRLEGLSGSGWEGPISGVPEPNRPGEEGTGPARWQSERTGAALEKIRDGGFSCGVPEVPFQILLYYLYTPLERPGVFLAEQLALCERLELRGRILIAGEGINGTVSGRQPATEEYMRVMRDDPRMEGISFKADPAEGHVFPKLRVRLREEMVTLGLGEEDFSPREETGSYLSPVEWRAMMEREDVVVLDARNDYEWELGRFEGAVLPRVQSFRELPEWVRRNRERLEGKKILTYCTGGVRCEKFSGFLRKEGFPEVYQLAGGIVTYGKDGVTRGEKFAGKCYVFDQRIAVEVNRSGESTVVSRCRHCGELSDRYVNCAWRRCNRQHFCCERCEAETRRHCGRACEQAALVSLAATAIESD